MPYSSGYALRRNGSCLSTETDCGQTTSPFYACCPGNMFCPAPQYNVMCCPSNANCSEVIGENCANSKADLYSSTSDVAAEGFCCERGKYAFTLEDKGVGCANNLSDLTVSMTQLQAISSASDISTSTTSPTSTTSGTNSTITSSSPSTSVSTTPKSTEEAKPASSSNTGAIAGGVVGGVAGAVILVAVLWFILRRRNKERQISELESTSPPSADLSQARKYFQPSDRQAHPSELDNKGPQRAAELSGEPITYE
ncbi:hypothetical protein N7504_010855 [Penicillium tannophilum]|nr:hypothetical protein N7504_010855 [Penicillium tannophilum]